MMTPISTPPLILLLLILLPSAATAAPDADTSNSNMTAPMEKSEQDALYSVIQSFVGKWWDGRQLYPDPCGWTAIQGVSCDLLDGLWYITSLSLGPLLENSLDCAAESGFTPELFRLKHLRSLSFYNCFSSAHHHPVTLPSTSAHPTAGGGWDSLAGSLETLEFRSNRGLVGSIPSDLGRLSSLQSLVMVENGLSGSLPPELGGLVRLRRLVLSSNNFSGPVPATLGRNLSKLLILDLSRNSLSGPLPAASLGGLKSLLKLDMSSNTIEGTLSPETSSLGSLTLLDLRNNRLSGGLSTAALRGLRSLQVMLLSNNPLLGGGIADIPWDQDGLLPNLTTLDLSNTGISGAIPDSLGTLSQLRFLDLSNNRLAGRVPTKLAELPSIGALYLNGNNLTGALEFSGAFYNRLGRRFGVSGNPNLCYFTAGEEDGEVTAGRRVPAGLNRCVGSDRLDGGSNSGSDKNDGRTDHTSAAVAAGPVGLIGLLLLWGLVVRCVIVCGC